MQKKFKLCEGCSHKREPKRSTLKNGIPYTQRAHNIVQGSKWNVKGKNVTESILL